RQRQERGQRDPGRLPGAGHDGRDHGARLRRHRSRGPGPGGPTSEAGGDVNRTDATLPTRLVFVAAVVGSLYLLLAGHNQPGGGFVGGIVAGAAVTLRYVTGGIDAVRQLSRAQPWTVLGIGLLAAMLTATVPVLLGGEVLESGYVELD